ncbi:hypothetical protein SEET535_16746, partial [Salmonella enterica subsp. enterica serovar Tennessee str. 4535]|uniref:hypothetical protein n=1 Tax=Salmonella enterica TaxID=28901 RepID=UPI0003ED99A4
VVDFVEGLEQWVFPAPAGINRQVDHLLIRINSVPRASGDKPMERGGYIGVPECSPRQRG